VNLVIERLDDRAANDVFERCVGTGYSSWRTCKTYAAIEVCNHTLVQID